VKLGVCFKLTATLLLASAVPLALGLAGMLQLGYRAYRSARGDLLQARAAGIAQSIGNVVSDQVADLSGWTWMSDLDDLAAEQDGAEGAIRQGDFLARVEELDRLWPSLDNDSPELSAVLTNRMAQLVKLYRSNHPLVVELLVTDRKGRLIAASNKTTDYWQADETWWKKAFRMRRNQVWVEGIHFDESASAYSLDVAIPIFREPDDVVVGVVKAVIDTLPLFDALPAQSGTEGFAHDILAAEGRIVAHLFGEKEQPFSRSVHAGVMGAVASGQGGWFVGEVSGPQSELAGYAPLRLHGHPAGGMLISGAYPLYILVHSDLRKAMAPVYFSLAMYGMAGLGILVALFLAGIYIAHRHLIGPLETLRSAVQSFSDSAVTGEVTRAEFPDGDPPGDPSANDDLVRRIDSIRTGDEIEGLARDFRIMANRVSAFLSSCCKMRK
jgi:HAMP domain-containing protein